jgi:flagellar hook assembly protein FlgD
MNETGATKESEVFSFKTLDIDSKLVKPVPNPFSPYREGTDIVFKIKTPQTVKIKIYSEFGDLEYQKEYFANSGMNNFHYDGKDNSGRVLYNGSHICRIETKEGVKTCYLAVVK